MKNLPKLLLAATLACAFLVPFAACNNTPDPNAEYNVEDYFEITVTNKVMFGSDIPTDDHDTMLAPLVDVVVTKITGTAYYNWDWYRSDENPLRHMKEVTTDVFVNNVTFPRDSKDYSFDFVMTPASSANASTNFTSIPDGVWKAGQEVWIARLPKCLWSFAVRNLKIEFYPV